jgi:hypothetical protein
MLGQGLRCHGNVEPFLYLAVRGTQLVDLPDYELNQTMDYVVLPLLLLWVRMTGKAFLPILCIDLSSILS